MALWSLHKTEICEYYRLSAFLVPDDLLVSASHHGRVSRCPVFEYDCQITGEGRGEGHIVISHVTVTSNYELLTTRVKHIKHLTVWVKTRINAFSLSLNRSVWASPGIAIISCRNETCLKCAAPLSWLLTPHDTKRRIQRERLSEYRRKQLLSPSRYWRNPIVCATHGAALSPQRYRARAAPFDTFHLHNIGMDWTHFLTTRRPASTSSAGGEARGGADTKYF